MFLVLAYFSLPQIYEGFPILQYSALFIKRRSFNHIRRCMIEFKRRLFVAFGLSVKITLKGLESGYMKRFGLDLLRNIIKNWRWNKLKGWMAQITFLPTVIHCDALLRHVFNNTRGTFLVLLDLWLLSVSALRQLLLEIQVVFWASWFGNVEFESRFVELQWLTKIEKTGLNTRSSQTLNPRSEVFVLARNIRSFWAMIHADGWDGYQIWMGMMWCIYLIEDVNKHIFFFGRPNVFWGL